MPNFNADSAYAFVQKQVDFGPRIPGTEAHKETLNWLVQQLEATGAKVQIQSGVETLYNGKKQQFSNIIASFNPDNEKRILLAAHWDTRPFADQEKNPENWNKHIDGANDGGSGVGVLLEIARQLQAKPVGIGVDIVLFDLEDWGQPEFDKGPRKNDTYALGAQYWSKNPHKAGYDAQYGILLDMVGDKNSTFLHESFSTQYAPMLLKKVWRVAGDLGYSNYFLYTAAPPIQDDHYYVNTVAGIPMIDVISLNTNSSDHLFPPSWHTLDDNMSNIDPKALKAVGQTVLTVVYREDAGAL